MASWNTFLVVGAVLLLVGGTLYVYENAGRSTITPVEVKTGEEKLSEAYFAGGCFWCVESDLEKLPDVKEVLSGYMGGDEENPRYGDVSSGSTNHRETVKVIYDPAKVSYEELVWHFFRHIDPTDAGGSFYDRGRQYTSAIYYQNEEEKEIAESVKQILEEAGVFDKSIATSIEKAGVFWQAEDYHQDYYKKNSLRYGYYRQGSGRDAFIEDTWGSGEFSHLGSRGGKDSWKNFMKPSDEELQKKLTSVQY